MSSPIIGITTFNDETSKEYPNVLLHREYIRAIIKANGIPLLIPSGLSADALNELLPKLNGLLFSGGGDISVDQYGGQYHPLMENVDQERDILEMTLMKTVIDRNIPFLGICRGIQVLNVAMGGTLYTNIASEMNDPLKHDYYPDHPRNKLVHKVELSSDNKYKTIFGSSVLEVNSMHHQGVKKVAEGLNAIGFAPDGLVEVLELKGHKFGLGVQWHPESLPDHSAMQHLFIAFIDASRGATRIWK